MRRESLRGLASEAPHPGHRIPNQWNWPRRKLLPDGCDNAGAHSTLPNWLFGLQSLLKRQLCERCPSWEGSMWSASNSDGSPDFGAAGGRNLYSGADDGTGSGFQRDSSVTCTHIHAHAHVHVHAHVCFEPGTNPCTMHAMSAGDPNGANYIYSLSAMCGGPDPGRRLARAGRARPPPSA